jgi:hypothetical protein
MNRQLAADCAAEFLILFGGFFGFLLEHRIALGVFLDNCARCFELRFEHENFRAVRPLRIFRNGERVGGNRTRRIDARTLQQAANDQRFGGILRNMRDYQRLVYVIFTHRDSSKDMPSTIARILAEVHTWDAVLTGPQ